MPRQEANREILKLLSRMVEKYDDWRFGQILVNMDLVMPGEDPFFPESTELLNRIIKGIKLNKL